MKHADDWPEIPRDWENTTNGNDVCPSFAPPPPSGRFVRVWVDYPDNSRREYQDLPRYCVTEYADEDYLEPLGTGEELISTDDWAEVLAYVATL